MNKVYKTLNNVRTHLITWDSPFKCNGSDVIICITGNPGIPDFYVQFASELHNVTKYPVCVIGHAGHEELPDNKSSELHNQEHLFNLEGQLNHKLDLINNHIDKKSKVHLIGHSIGAWLVLELLENEAIFSRVSSVNLLFPTIQKMAQSKNGKFFNNIIRNLHTFILFLFTAIHLLPESVRLFLINMYLKLHSLPRHYSQVIVKFLNPKIIKKVLFMAYDEMDKVTSLNTPVIEKAKHLINVIYSTNDGWVPLYCMEDLKRFQLEMKETDIDHSFVLKSSERVAEMVINFIKTKCE